MLAHTIHENKYRSSNSKIYDIVKFIDIYYLSKLYLRH